MMLKPFRGPCWFICLLPLGQNAQEEGFCFLLWVRILLAPFRLIEFFDLEGFPALKSRSLLIHPDLLSSETMYHADLASSVAIQAVWVATSYRLMSQSLQFRLSSSWVGLIHTEYMEPHEGLSIHATGRKECPPQTLILLNVLIFLQSSLNWSFAPLSECECCCWLLFVPTPIHKFPSFISPWYSEPLQLP